LEQHGIESNELLLVWGEFIICELHSALRFTALYLGIHVSVCERQFWHVTTWFRYYGKYRRCQHHRLCPM